MEWQCDQQNSKLSSTIIANSCVHALIDDKIMKVSFNKNNAATIKNKQCSIKSIKSILSRRH